MLALLPWLGPVIVFGLVVFVHELGHFIAAKLTGVYAPRFSIGFGPALLKKRWGETEYVLAALPLGGYVRMASRDDEATAFLEGGSETARAAESAGGNAAPALVGGEGAERPRPRDWDPEAMIPFGPKPVPEHRWFESKPLPARLFIMLAGVTMNVLLTFAIYSVLVAHFGMTTNPTRVVGGVQPVAAAPALARELQVGDTIIAVAGRPVQTWNDVRLQLLQAEGDTVALTTSRGTVRVPAGPPESDQRAVVALSIQPFTPPVIDSVLPNTPAARGGLRAGDSVVAVAGAPVQSWSQLVSRVSAAPGQQVTLDVARGGERRTITVVPDSTREQDPVTGEARVVGKIGAMVRERVLHQPVSPGTAVALGWKATWTGAGAIVTVVKRLVTREASIKQLGGPIAITRAAVSAARSGWEEFLGLIALISINVAVLNLLPIPILDGGQVVLNLVEAAKGGALSARTREYVLRFGLLAIALLFVVVMYNDLSRLYTDFMAMLRRAFS